MGERVVGGRFVLASKAGAGGMSVVWRALDQQTGRTVAVKLVSGGVDPARFTREALVLAQLDHPGIVDYVAHGASESGEPFLAMEWIEGEDLATRLTKGPLEQRAALALVHALAEALAYAHALGIVHRDLKPANVMLPGGDARAPKLLDFGIARVRASKATLPGAVFGTPGYMAPEQARGEHGVDARADVFALGAVAFECFAGRPAFEGDHPMVILGKVIAGVAPRLREHATVPAWLDELVARMMARDPSGRPADAAVVLGELVAERRRGAEAEPSGPASTVDRPSSTWSLTTALRYRTAGVVTVPGDEPVRTDAPTETSDVSDMGAQRALFGRVEGGYGVRVEVLGRHGLLVMGASPMAFEPQRVLAATIDLVEALSEAGPRAGGVATGRGDGLLPPEVVTRAVRASEGALAGTVAADELTLTLNGRLDLSSRVVQATGGSGGRAIASSSRFVGRAKELALLEASLDEARTGGARSVVVSGAPGVGKSRLAGALEERLRSLGVRTLAARARPLPSPPAFGLLGELIRGALGLESSAQADEALSALQQTGAWPRGPSRDAERLAALLFAAAEAVPESGDLAVGAGEAARRAFEQLAAHWCGEGPLALVVDDAELGDVPSLEAIGGLLRALPTRPLLVVGFTREGGATARAWGGSLELMLPELTRAASEALVRDLLGAKGQPELVARILAKGGGNAFFLEELTRAALSGKADLTSEGVLALLEERLDALGDGARTVLRAASLVGGVLDLGLLEELLGAEGPLGPALDELVRRGLLEVEWRGAGPTYSFRSEVVRDAVYAGFGPERAQGHARAARALERRRVAPAVLADHLERAGERPAAVQALVRAAEHAKSGSDLGAVLSTVARAARLGASGETLGALRALAATAHIWRAEYADAEGAATEAMRLLPRGSRAWLGAAFDLGYAYAQTSRGSALVELLEGVRSYADVDPAGVAVAMSMAANGLALVGELDRSDQLFQEIESIAPLATLGPAASARVLGSRGIAALVRGNVAGFRRDRGEAARRYDEAGELQLAAEMVLSLGYALILVGRYAEAARAIRASVGESIRLGSSRLELLGKHNLGLALARLGQLDEAVALERFCLEGFAQAGDRRLGSTSATYLAFALMGQNRLSDAEQTLRDALALDAPAACQCETLAHLANVLRAQGRVAEAMESAQRAFDLLRELGSIDEADAFVRVVYAECLLAVGRADDARAVLLEARRRVADAAARMDDPADRASFLCQVPENARTLALADQLCHLPA